MQAAAGAGAAQCRQQQEERCGVGSSRRNGAAWAGAHNCGSSQMQELLVNTKMGVSRSTHTCLTCGL